MFHRKPEFVKNLKQKHLQIHAYITYFNLLGMFAENLCIRSFGCLFLWDNPYTGDLFKASVESVKYTWKKRSMRVAESFYVT